MADTTSIYERLSRGEDPSTSGSRRLIRGAGGTLQEVTGEEVQSLSQKLGRPSPPVTPLGGSGLGLSPDAAAQLGTGRQKAAALDIGAGGESQVSRAERTQQARTASTEAERGLIQKSESLARLGSIGDKVHNLINTEFSKLQFTPTEGTAEGSEEYTKQLMSWAGTQGVDPATVTKLLQEGKTQQEIIDSVSQSAADTAGSRTADYSQLGLTSTIADESGNQVPLYQSLGFSSVDEISNLLGTDVSGMTFAELEDTINQVTATEFSRADELRATMSDPNASPAMREEARRALRDMGALGTASAEQQAEDVRAAVEGADVLQVGGKDYTLEQILSDDGMSDIIEEYAGLTDEEKQELRESNPEFSALYDFADDHEKAITAAKEATASTAEQVTAGRTSRMEKYQVGGISSDVLEELWPEWDSYGDAGNPPAILDQLSSSSNPSEAAKKISRIKELDPTLFSELATATEDDLAELGLLGVDSRENRDRWQELETLLTSSKAIDYQDLFEGLGRDPEELENELGYLLESIGERALKDDISPEERQLLDLFDSDGNRRLDDWSEVSNRLSSPENRKSLASALEMTKGSRTLEDAINNAFTSGNLADAIQLRNQGSQFLSSEQKKQLSDIISEGLERKKEEDRLRQEDEANKKLRDDLRGAKKKLIPKKIEKGDIVTDPITGIQVEAY